MPVQVGHWVRHAAGRDQVARGGDRDGRLRFQCDAVLPEAPDEGPVGFLVLVSYPGEDLSMVRSAK